MSLMLPIKPSESWKINMYDQYNGYDSENTTILLGEFQGENNSTIFKDKTQINTFSAYGQAVIDTLIKTPFNDYSGNLYLPGTDSSAVQINDNSNWDIDTSQTILSIECFVNFDSTFTGIQAFFSAGDTGSQTSSTRVWCFRLRDDNGVRLEFTFCNNDSWTNIQSSIIPTPQAGEWHHYAMTINKNQITFYYDGVNVGSSTFTLNIFPQSGALIGAISYSSPTWQRPCRFSEVRLVKGTLPWTSNFSVPTTRYKYFYKALKVCWSFDKDLLTDDSKNGHTLSNINNVIRVEGMNNSAAKFGGSSYLESLNSFNLYDKSYLISFWFYIPNESMSSSKQYGLFKFQDTTEDGFRCWCDSERFSIRLNTNNDWPIQLDNGYNGGAWKPSIGWHHFVFARIDSTDFYYLFLDNQLKQKSVNTGQLPNTNMKIQIGYGMQNNYWFSNSDGDGQIDEFLCITDIDTEEELESVTTQLYNKANGRYFRKRFAITYLKPLFFDYFNNGLNNWNINGSPTIINDPENANNSVVYLNSDRESIEKTLNKNYTLLEINYKQYQTQNGGDGGGGIVLYSDTTAFVEVYFRLSTHNIEVYDGTTTYVVASFNNNSRYNITINSFIFSNNTFDVSVNNENKGTFNFRYSASYLNAFKFYQNNNDPLYIDCVMVYKR